MSASQSLQISAAKQSGAFLLAFVLMLVVASSYILLRELNTASLTVNNNIKTINSLYQAKSALIAWAVNHPVNPGTLPMPDRQETSDPNYDGDADCVNGDISDNQLLGKIPWRNYPSPCKDAGKLSGIGTDDVGASGEVPWYAVSRNLVYETPDYPFISPALLDKTSGWITVRDSSGAVISDRVAFVLIDPGPALDGQVRSGSAPDPDQYLDAVTISGVTYDNSDDDQVFIIYPDSKTTSITTDSFNDTLIFVTIDELMGKVINRVLSETGNILSSYHNTYGALPWLSPYADPKATIPIIRGVADSGSSTTLNDTGVDFANAGVAVNDVVRNVTDESIGIIDSVGANSLTVSSLLLGNNNDFGNGDVYYISPQSTNYVTGFLSGTATSGSSGPVLEDTSKDFEELGIKPGDIIKNTIDDSSFVITDVAGDQITVESSTSGDKFPSGDTYQIRSNMGTATSGSGGLVLEDTSKDFTTMGLVSGDIVEDITDGSYGTINSVTATTVTVNALNYGTNNVFNDNDLYIVYRYNPLSSTKQGLLGFHEPGRVYTSDYSFDAEWSAAGETISTQLVSGNDTLYQSALASSISTSSGTLSSSLNINMSGSYCAWLVPAVVDCKIDKYTDSNFLTGTATSGSSITQLYDTSKDFITTGIKPGDKLENTSDSRTGFVVSVSSSTQASINNFYAMTDTGISSGDSYRIKVATSSVSGTSDYSDWYTGDPTPYWRFYLQDTSKNFYTTVNLGDIVVDTDNGGIGRVEYKWPSPYTDWILVRRLTGGSYTRMYTGGNYKIYDQNSYVDSRTYDFGNDGSGSIKFTGSNNNSVNNGGVREREICLGYSSDCSTISTAESLPVGNDPFLIITDKDSSNNELGNAKLTLENSVATGNLRVENLAYYLNEIDDIPEWFIRNKWYQYVYIAYSDGDTPGGTVCTPSPPSVPPCLTLNLYDSQDNLADARSDIRAMIFITANELSGQSWVNAGSSDYFDSTENINADDIFERHFQSGTFNDRIRIATSCPSDTSKLCWSH